MIPNVGNSEPDQLWLNGAFESYFKQFLRIQTPETQTPKTKTLNPYAKALNPQP